MTQRLLVKDDFAGPGGWSLSLARLAAEGVPLLEVGIEWDDAACATRAAAGLVTIQGDIAEMDHREAVQNLPVWGYIASPPCQGFSQAGKGQGRKDTAVILEAVQVLAAGGEITPELLDKCEDHRSLLVTEPVRAVRDLNPEWVCLEQVPAVLPLWEVMADVFRGWGYHVWTGKLKAEEYGTPQTRVRAVLIASRVREVGRPKPTHRVYKKGVARSEGDQALLPWVSMADAIGWGLTERPTTAVMSRSEGGAPRPLDGGAGSRAVYVDGKAEGDWVMHPEDVPQVGFPRLNDRDDGYVYRERDLRPIDEPALTVTEKARSWKMMTNVLRDNATVRTMDEPAPTITGGHDHAERQWVPGDEGTVLNTGRDWKPGGTRDDAQKIDAERPAPAVTGQANAWWWQEERRNDQSQSGESDPEWPLDRPATAIAGRGLVPDPGANANRFNGAKKSRNDGYRVTLSEAGLLQGFPADYPWQGNNTKQFEQVGNAVPTQLSYAVLRVAMGLDGYEVAPPPKPKRTRKKAEPKDVEPVAPTTEGVSGSVPQPEPAPPSPPEPAQPIEVPAAPLVLPQTWIVYEGNALKRLAELPDESIHVAITSPPYWGGLRDYLGNDEQLGHEPHPRLYALALADILDVVKDKLRPEGTLWLNLGDAYVGSGGAGGDYGKGGMKEGQEKFPGSRITARNFEWPNPLQGWAQDQGCSPERLVAELINAGWSPPAALKDKDQGGAPWEVARELRQRGWWLRCDVIWHKPNVRPGGGHLDRPTIDHEYVFQLTKSPRCFYDAFAVRVPAKSTNVRDLLAGGGRDRGGGSMGPDDGGKAAWDDLEGDEIEDIEAELRALPVDQPMRNRRSVWSVSVSGYKGMHFATFSPDLVEPMIEASTSAVGVCAECGAPWKRLEEKLTPSTYTELKERLGWNTNTLDRVAAHAGKGQDRNAITANGTTPHLAARQATTVAWTRTCQCYAGAPIPALVLDPFAGAGSAGMAALKLGRSFVGVELNPPYCSAIEERLRAAYPDAVGCVMPLA